MNCLNENDRYLEFETFDEKIEKLRVWKMISPKAASIKQIVYKGVAANGTVFCNVVGYIESDVLAKDNDPQYETAVIEIGNDTHKINAAYLKQMQKKEFLPNKYETENREV